MTALRVPVGILEARRSPTWPRGSVRASQRTRRSDTRALEGCRQLVNRERCARWRLVFFTLHGELALGTSVSLRDPSVPALRAGRHDATCRRPLRRTSNGTAFRRSRGLRLAFHESALRSRGSWSHFTCGYFLRTDPPARYVRVHLSVNVARPIRFCLRHEPREHNRSRLRPRRVHAPPRPGDP